MHPADSGWAQLLGLTPDDLDMLDDNLTRLLRETVLRPEVWTDFLRILVEFETPANLSLYGTNLLAPYLVEDGPRLQLLPVVPVRLRRAEFLGLLGQLRGKIRRVHLDVTLQHTEKI